MIFIPALGIAKDGLILGKVLDKEDQSPIIGAHIVVRNSEPMIGSISDINGNNSIDLK